MRIVAATAVSLIISATAAVHAQQQFNALPYLLSGGFPPTRPTPLKLTELERFEAHVASVRARLLSKTSEFDTQLAWAHYKSAAVRYGTPFVVGSLVGLHPPAGLAAITMVFGSAAYLQYHADQLGDHFVSSVETLRRQAIDNLVAEFIGSDFKTQINDIRLLSPRDRTRALSELISSASTLRAGMNDPEVGEYLSRLIYLLQSELNSTDLAQATRRADELLARAGKRETTSQAERRLRVEDTHQAFLQLADALGVPLERLVDSMVALVPRTAHSGSTQDIARRDFLDALDFASSITRNANAILPAFANLGVDQEVIADVSEAVFRIESGIQLVASAARLYGNDPTAIMPVIQGLSGLLGGGGGKSDGLARMLGALQSSLYRIEERLDRLLQGQRIIHDAILRFELDTRVAFIKIDREIGLVRQEIAAATGDLAFQEFRNCNSMAYHVSRDPAAYMGIGDVSIPTYAQSLNETVRVHKSLVTACLAALNSLFGSPDALSLSNPFLRDDRQADSESQYSIHRRELFFNLLAVALSGRYPRPITNEQLRNYLSIAMFESDPLIMSILWRTASNGGLMKPRFGDYLRTDALPRFVGINPVRLAAVVSIVLNVVPAYWFLDKELKIVDTPDLDQVIIGSAILDNVLRIQMEAIFENAVANEGILIPITSAFYRRKIDEFINVYRLLSSEPPLKHEREYANRIEYESARERRQSLEKQKSDIRRDVFKLEAYLMTDSRLVQRSIDFEFYQAIVERVGAFSHWGFASGSGWESTFKERADLMASVADMFLKSKAIGAGKRFYWATTGGGPRDIYWEILNGTSFSSQEDRELFFSLYDPSECRAQGVDDYASWVKIDKRPEVLVAYCNRIAEIARIERENEQYGRDVVHAYFAGSVVNPPRAKKGGMERNDTALLLGNYAATRQLITATSSDVAEVDGMIKLLER
jgi:hypothetical protein